MRRKMLCVLAVLCFFAFLLPVVSAADPLAGTVLFAQRYADLTDVRFSGIRVGTSGGTPRLRTDGALQIDVTDDLKAYLLLPDVPDGGAWCDTYTVTFSFRFTDVASANGYFGFLMTAQGDGPSNRTEVLLRASGTCDGVGDLDPAIAEALAAGETVSVSIFVDHGMMYEIRLRAGGNRQSLTLPAVKTIGTGSRGFVLRNASVAVESVEVISGVSYDGKLGSFASDSYWIKPESPDAPDTADVCLTVLPVLTAAAVGTVCFGRRRRV